MASRTDLINEFKNKNLPTYGSIEKMKERLECRKVFTLKVKLLQEVCRPYSLPKAKKLDQLIDTLRENDIVWHFDDTTGNVTHWKDGFDRLRFVTDFDGFTEQLQSVSSAAAPIVKPADESALSATASTTTDDKCAEMIYVDAEVPSEDCLPSRSSDSNDMEMNEDFTLADTGIAALPLDMNHRSVDQPQIFNVAVASIFSDMNLDGDINFSYLNLDGPNDDDNDTDTEECCDDWSIYVQRQDKKHWACTICGIVRASRANAKNHILVQHLPQLCSHITCTVCGGQFVIETGSYRHHMRTGHIDIAGDVVIVKGNDEDENFRLQTNFIQSDDADSLLQKVFIPWIDNAGEKVQLSVGWTKTANVKYYASRIWRSVLQALKDRQIYVKACGSAVIASGHNIVMDPAGAFAPGLFMSGRAVANKLIVDAIRHNSANDVFGYLNSVEAHIIRKMKATMSSGNMPLHNYNVLLATLNGDPVSLSQYNRRTFDVRFISSILEYCDLDDLSE